MPDASSTRIVGIILAAGASMRLGRPKQLLDLSGTPVIAHVVERALTASLDDVIVVTGGAGEAVAEAVSGYPVRTVSNPAFRDGQSTSLIAGLNALPEETDAVVVMLGDQPGIDPADISALVARRREVPSGPIVMTAYGTERSHPILFGREVFPELLAIHGDQGGRDVIRAHASEVATITSSLPVPPLDLDTEDAYRALLARWPGI